MRHVDKTPRGIMGLPPKVAPRTDPFLSQFTPQSRRVFLAFMHELVLGASEVNEAVAQKFGVTVEEARRLIGEMLGESEEINDAIDEELRRRFPKTPDRE